MKLNIDIDALQKATKKAVAEAKEKKQTEVERAKAAAERLKKQEEFQAKQVIEGIPDKCGSAAERGQSKAVVMKLDYAKHYDYRNNSVALKGAAELVWAACKDAKLHPKIEQWDDGVGINGGFQIVVEW